MAEILFRMRSGPLGVWRWLADRRSDRRRDQEFGLETSERRGSENLGFDNPDYVQYQAISYRDLRQVLDGIPIDANDVFLDLGAGMGRAVCLAATYPFRAVIGVEIAPELCAIAQQNIERTRDRMRCTEVQVINCNATEYEVRDDVTVFYFFNPFGGEVLEKVLAKIGESLQKAPRLARILFYGTVSSEEFRNKAARQSWMAMRRETTLATGAVVLEYRNAAH